MLDARIVAAIIVVVAAIAGAAAYFAIIIAFLPQAYPPILVPPRPAPVIISVSLSEDAIALGSEFSVRVSASNRGDPADLQLVSVAFPNATRADVVTIDDHNFTQTPYFIRPGDEIGAGYTGIQNTVAASYPAVEAISRPWEAGEAFSVDLSVRPESEGRFVVFVKSVGLPHNGEQAHYPGEGVIDQQNEYVAVYEVLVTKA